MGDDGRLAVTVRADAEANAEIVRRKYAAIVAC